MWYFGIGAVLCCVLSMYFLYASDVYEWKHSLGWFYVSCVLIVCGAALTSAFCNTM